MIQNNKLQPDKSRVFCDWCIEPIGTIEDMEMGLLKKQAIVVSDYKEQNHFCNKKCAKAFAKKNFKK